MKSVKNSFISTVNKVRPIFRIIVSVFSPVFYPLIWFFKNLFKFLWVSFISFTDSVAGLYIFVKLGFIRIIDIVDWIFGANFILDVPEVEQEKEVNTHSRAIKHYAREKFFDLLSSPKLMSVDRLEIFISIYNISYNIFSDTKTEKSTLPRIFYRLKNYSYKPYVHTYSKYSLATFIRQSKKHFLYGWLSLWSFVRRWILSLTLGLLSIYFLSYMRLLPVNVTLFQWFTLTMFLYWLLSGFVFFIKKYQFTRYTSVIQRFWRRSYILFWLIESCLLVVFFYLTFNASQESPFMLDQIQIFKSHLFSWRTFLPKLFLVSFLVVFGYLLLLNIKWNIFKKSIPIILLITALLTYLLWVEFYQIYHVSNFYSNLFWVYEVEDRTWVLETDARRTRLVNHYMMILFILKFWHIVFIYGFWIFFVLRANELNRVRYPIYAANFQNFIILYIMSWIFMYPWLKATFHRFIEVPYFWFYVNNRELGIRIFLNDLKLVIFGMQDAFSVNVPYRFDKWSYYYWLSSDSTSSFSSYRKHWIRDNIITTLHS